MEAFYYALFGTLAVLCLGVEVRKEKAEKTISSEVRAVHGKLLCSLREKASNQFGTKGSRLRTSVGCCPVKH